MRAYLDRFPFNEMSVGQCMTVWDPRVWDEAERAAKAFEYNRSNFFFLMDLDELNDGTLVFRIWRVRKGDKYEIPIIASSYGRWTAEGAKASGSGNIERHHHNHA